VGHFVSLAPVVVSPSVTQSAEQAEPAQARSSVSMGHLAYTTLFLTFTHILITSLKHQMMYPIFSYSFRVNDSFLSLEIQRLQYTRPKVTLHKCAETITVCTVWLFQRQLLSSLRK
jgi:hypothetical protein